MSEAHGVDEHAGGLQRRAVADAGNLGVLERWLEGDHYLSPNLVRAQRDRTLRQAA